MRMTTSAVCILMFSVSVASATAPIPYYTQKLVVESGVHVGRKKIQTFVGFSEVVKFPEAPWLQLHFNDYNLGKQSYITIMSLEDGAQQRFDAVSLKQWQNKSAFFNGDAVKVELHVSAGDEGIFFEIREVIVGKRYSSLVTVGGMCGDADDRIRSNVPAVGRVVPVNMTGWIGSNGAYFSSSAGSSQLDLLQILEFNVPRSDPDGAINHPPVEDQYPIDQTSIKFFGGTLSLFRWSVFNCNPNSNTGLLPVHGQNAFYRMSKDRIHGPCIARITGFGVDGPPPGFGDLTAPRNSNSQWQQTASGSINCRADIGTTGDGLFYSINYSLDTNEGNEGSPITTVINGIRVAFGIHTLSCPFGMGVGFATDELEAAIQMFPGENIVYVDHGHPTSLEDGTVFRPFKTVLQAVNAVPEGSIVSIVTGSYGDPITINRSMALTAPVGAVTIGE